MKAWFENWKRKKARGLEHELRANRPVAPERLVKAIATRVNPRSVSPVSGRARLGLAAAVTASMAVILGMTGGFSAAASGIAGVTHSVTHVTSSAPSSSKGPTSAASQYLNAPVLDSLSPVSGKVGAKVDVYGSYFTGSNVVTKVTFGGTLTSFTVLASDHLQFIVPSDDAGQYAVVAYNSTGSSNSLVFTINAAKGFPVVTTFSPNQGDAGTTPVTITGLNFSQTATQVTFGSSAAHDVTAGVSTDGKTISTTLPADATTGVVCVYTDAGGGCSKTSFFVHGTPSIDSFSPAFGKPGTPIKIFGSNFIDATEVDFGATPGVGMVVKGDGEIDVKVPDIAAGAVTIKVINPEGNDSATGFVVNEKTGAPIVTKWDPGVGDANGPTVNVTITGRFLTGTTEVDFGGVAGSNIVVAPDGNSLTVDMPAGAHSGQITVINAAGAGASKKWFIVQRVPVPFGFSPANGRAGTKVVFTGDDLAGVTQVDYPGGVSDTSPKFSIVKGTEELTSTVPRTATGSGQLTLHEGSDVANVATTDDAFTILAARPTALAFDTSHAYKWGDSVTITGSGFTGVFSVKIGGKAAGFTFVSDTEIDAVVPDGSKSGPILVQNLLGATSSGATKIAIVPPPTVTSFAPPSQARGSAVTINGMNFCGTVALASCTVNDVTVTFPGAAAVHPSSLALDKSGNPTGKALTVTIPGGATTGAHTITVTTNAGDGTSKKTLTIT